MNEKSKNSRSGFTLIETLMAMAIFTIGILGLFGMQTSVIKKNLSANAITTGSTWAADRVEWVIGLDYSDLNDGNGNGCNGLNDWPVADSGLPLITSGTVEPIYNIYWNVANDCTLSNIPDASSADQEQKPKYVQIIVTKIYSDGKEKEAAVFHYMKQNVQIK